MKSDPNDIEDNKALKLHSDSELLGQQPIMMLAYSRASNITVCSDDSYIHGIQITL